MHPKNVVEWVFLPFVLVMTGCMQLVPITSGPSGASVVVDGTSVGDTPTEVSLSPSQNHVIYVKKEGYIQERIDVRSISETHSTSSYNATTGATSTNWTTSYHLEPRSVHVNLFQVPVQAPPAPPLNVQLQQINQWLQEGVISQKEANALRRVFSLSPKIVGSHSFPSSGHK